MILMKGALVSGKIRSDIQKKIQNQSVVPMLAIIVADNNEAGAVYATQKEKACHNLGIHCRRFQVSDMISQKSLIRLIEILNQDSEIDGIICELPFPAHIAADEVLAHIAPQKDVDCVTDRNLGQLLMGTNTIAPATASAVMEMLAFYNIPLTGKRCCIVNRSNIIGKPLSLMMTHKNATVTICHSFTGCGKIKEICRNSDIVVSAVGIPGFLTSDMVGNDAVLIDVGTSRADSGKLCGDIAPDIDTDRISYLAKTPGGVGPLTVTMALKNLITIWSNNKFGGA